MYCLLCIILQTRRLCAVRPEKRTKNGTKDSYQMKHDWKTMIVRVVNGNKQVFKGYRVCNFH